MRNVSDGVTRNGECQVCGRTLRLRTNGTLWHHDHGRTWDGWGKLCAGSGCWPEGHKDALSSQGASDA